MARFYKYGRFWYTTKQDALKYRGKQSIIYYDAGMSAYYIINPIKRGFWNEFPKIEDSSRNNKFSKVFCVFFGLLSIFFILCYQISFFLYNNIKLAKFFSFLGLVIYIFFILIAMFLLDT